MTGSQCVFRDRLRTFIRFPVPVFLSLMMTYLFLNFGETMSPASLVFIQGVAFNFSPITVLTQSGMLVCAAIFFCGICWFLAGTLFWEGRYSSQKVLYLIMILIYLGISRHIHENFDSGYNNTLFISGIFGLIFCAPVLDRNRVDDEFWLFSYRMILRILYAVLVSCIFLLGGVAILFALQYLFDFTVYNNQYKDLAIVSFFTLLPFLIFSGIPFKLRAELTGQAYQALYYLLEYLLIPLLIIYSLVLYAYSLKILIEQSLPRGNIAYLVITYGMIGILTYLISVPKGLNTGYFVKFYRRYFFKILMVPALLLWVSIWYRIKQYGLTESRYLVVIFSLFISFSIVFSFVIRPEYRAKIIYTMLPCLFLIGSLGPWSIDKLPAALQVRMLAEILQKNHILRDGVITSNENILSEADKMQISAIAQYLCRTRKIGLLENMYDKETSKRLFSNHAQPSYEAIKKSLGADTKPLKP